MTRKTANKAIGLALEGEQRRRVERLRQQAVILKGPAEGAPRAGGVSVLEQTSLDDLIATVELRKEAYAEEIGEAEYVQEGPTLLAYGPRGVIAAERAAYDRRELVSIPRRPKWREGMTVEQLAKLESEAFIEWRRGLALAAQEEGLHLTPYERNLDFWRQLWRCIERSDLLVQIVDARDPDFYHCRDLGRYVEELGADKRLVLLVNKADFLTSEQRARWAEHFQARGIDAVFFSALRELRRQHQRPAAEGAAPEDGAEVPVPGLHDSDDDLAAEAREGEPEEGAAGAEEALEVGEGERGEDRQEGEEEEEEAPLGPLADDDAGVADAAKLLEELCARLPAAAADSNEASSVAGSEKGARCRKGTVGFVGFPNVGKSTVINALVGAKRVAMSKRPGKTKHIQTLELQDVGVTLCDCPGLVFPSVAATKAHLVINNTVPLDDLRECFSPVALIIEKVGFAKVLDWYGCAGAVKEARLKSGDHVLDDSHAFLAALALSRRHLLRVCVPDENWAARKVLRDYVSGALLHCEAPPELPPGGLGAAGLPQQEQAAASTAAPASGAEAPADADEGSEEDEFADLAPFLQEARRGKGERGMTKRRMRQINKQLVRGLAPVEAADCVGVSRAVCHGAGGRR